MIRLVSTWLMINVHLKSDNFISSTSTHISFLKPEFINLRQIHQKVRHPEPSGYNEVEKAAHICEQPFLLLFISSFFGLCTSLYNLLADRPKVCASSQIQNIIRGIL